MVAVASLTVPGVLETPMPVGIDGHGRLSIRWTFWAGNDAGMYPFPDTHARLSGRTPPRYARSISRSAGAPPGVRDQRRRCAVRRSRVGRFPRCPRTARQVGSEQRTRRGWAHRLPVHIDALSTNVCVCAKCTHDHLRDAIEKCVYFVVDPSGGT